MKRLPAVLLALIVLADVAEADIIVDGVSYGDSYVLDHTVNQIEMSSGQLTVTQNGNINWGLDVSGGTAVLEGGNISGIIDVSGHGFLEADTAGNLNISGIINASGQGEIQLVQLSNFSGEMNVSGNSVLRMFDTVGNVNGRITTSGNGQAYLEEEYTFNHAVELDDSGQILSPKSGSMYGNGCNISYKIKGSKSAIFVGQIPEPMAVTFICMTGLGFLIARRFLGRFGVPEEDVFADSAWPLPGDQMRAYLQEDFVSSNSAEWSRVEWNQRECRWMLRIFNQIPMPRLQFADAPSIEIVEPPQAPEEPVSFEDPSLIALPERPPVHCVRFYTETFMRQASKNQHRKQQSYSVSKYVSPKKKRSSHVHHGWMPLISCQVPMLKRQPKHSSVGFVPVSFPSRSPIKSTRFYTETFMRQAAHNLHRG